MFTADIYHEKSYRILQLGKNRFAIHHIIDYWLVERDEDSFPTKVL